MIKSKSHILPGLIVCVNNKSHNNKIGIVLQRDQYGDCKVRLDNGEIIEVYCKALTENKNQNFSC